MHNSRQGIKEGQIRKRHQPPAAPALPRMQTARVALIVYPDRASQGWAPWCRRSHLGVDAVVAVGAHGCGEGPGLQGEAGTVLSNVAP